MEYIKANTTAEGFSKLETRLQEGRQRNRRQASGINDSAAAVIVMSADKAAELGIKPMAKVISYASGGVDPKIKGIGPVPAVRKALAKANMTIDDIDLIEANGAFAAQFPCAVG